MFIFTETLPPFLILIPDVVILGGKSGQSGQNIPTSTHISLTLTCICEEKFIGRKKEVKSANEL